MLGSEQFENGIVSAFLNPRDLKHPLLIGHGVGLASGFATGQIISGLLHREIHGGVIYDERVRKVLVGANFMLTGMAPLDWVDHLVHHEYADRYDEEAHTAWNESIRPDGYPLAPKEAFRDPYSVVLEGYKAVFLNTSGLHRKAKMELVPFVLEMDRLDKLHGTSNKKHWPQPFQHLDIDRYQHDSFVNQYPYAGIIGGSVLKAGLIGPGPSIVESATHLTALFSMGGFVNAVNHTAEGKGFMRRTAVLLGKREPVRNEDGELAADLMEGFEGIIAGEPRHKRHHKYPSDPYLVGYENTTLLRDPPGCVIKVLERHGLAETPGAIKIAA